MNEKPPELQQQDKPGDPGSPGNASDQPGADDGRGPWARHEEAGDVYSVEINPDGTVERADMLPLRPSVWIGCLAAYNNGTLHGEWVDAAVEGDELVAAAQRVLAASPEPRAEEWAIFDHDEFGAYCPGKYEPLDHVATVARGIAEHDHPFATWAHLHDGDESMLARFGDAYLGQYDSPEAWAHEVLDELNLDGFLRLGAIPETIRPYLRIDYEGWARDARLSGDVDYEDAPDGGIYVFLSS